MRKTKIQDIDPQKSKEAAEKKAREHFKIAESLAAQGEYPAAYSFLVYSLEEMAKSKICMVYESFKDSKDAEGYRGIPHKLHIKPESVEQMFSSHPDKHLTMLTQSIFELTNTPDADYSKKIKKAIRERNPHADIKLINLLKIFKDMQKKREAAIHSSCDGSCQYNFEEEYNSLYPYAKDGLDRINQFVTMAYIEYFKTEEDVKTMLQMI